MSGRKVLVNLLKGDNTFIIICDEHKLTLNKLLYTKYILATTSDERQNITQFKTMLITFFEEILKYLGTYYSKQDLQQAILIIESSIEDLGITDSFIDSKVSLIYRLNQRAIIKAERL